MTTAWKPKILTTRSGARILHRLAQQFQIIVTDHKSTPDREVTFLDDIGNLIEPTQLTDALAYVSETSDKSSDYQAVLRFWQSHIADDAVPPHIKLNGASTSSCETQLLSLLIANLISLSERNVRLMRELGAIRAEHNETQRAFEKLETFFYETGRVERTSTLTLSVDSSAPTLDLKTNQETEFRLPTNSAGLSDVAIFIVNPNKDRNSTEHLVAELQLRESSAIIATWTISGSDIREGWLRMSLTRALGPDNQTPFLRLRWTGARQLGIATSFNHPDKRFIATGANRMLAVQIWKTAPSLRLALPANTFPEDKNSDPEKWTVGPNHLRDAEPLVGVANIIYSDNYTGLLVKPKDNTISVAKIVRAVHPGTNHIFGGIKTEDTAGPIVEYAYAVAPSRIQVRGTQQLFELPDYTKSEWFPLPPGQWAELHLFLAEAVQEPHDLLLLTRLGEGQSCDQPPNACFFKITAEAIQPKTVKRDTQNA